MIRIVARSRTSPRASPLAHDRVAGRLFEEKCRRRPPSSSFHAEEQLGLTLPYVAVAWIEKRSVELREKLKPVPAIAAAGELVDTSFDEVGLKVHPSAASSATALRRRTGALVLMPRTRITDLLAKLISLTGFAGRCVHFRTGGAAANLAILLAEATNISLERMTW